MLCAKKLLHTLPNLQALICGSEVVSLIMLYLYIWVTLTVLFPFPQCSIVVCYLIVLDSPVSTDICFQVSLGYAMFLVKPINFVFLGSIREYDEVHVVLFKEVSQSSK